MLQDVRSPEPPTADREVPEGDDHSEQRRAFKDVKRALVDEFERRYLRHLLERHGANLSAAERASGLSRRHLRDLMRKHGMYEEVVRTRIATLLDELRDETT